jgi:multicomponent Na+:H+ antiporter subunit C
MAQFDTAILVAILGAGAIYLCLSRRFLRMLLGFLLLSNAGNLVVLSMSGNPTGKRAATLRNGTEPWMAVDPLPQSLILTAIVIGFSVAAYLTVLLYRIYVDAGTATTPGLDRAGSSDGLDDGVIR